MLKIFENFEISENFDNFENLKKNLKFEKI